MNSFKIKKENKQKKKILQLNVILKRDCYNKLCELADINNLNHSQLVRQMIEYCLIKE